MRETHASEVDDDGNIGNERGEGKVTEIVFDLVATRHHNQSDVQARSDSYCRERKYYSRGGVHGRQLVVWVDEVRLLANWWWDDRTLGEVHGSVRHCCDTQ